VATGKGSSYGNALPPERIAPKATETEVQRAGLPRLNMEEKTGVTIPFPVIADLNKEVAQAYGMLMPGESKTETSRCVFFIDPKGILRAMIYYPLSLGRNMDEVLRVIDALQTATANGVATPANWRPGDKVIIPAPNTQEMAEERVKAGYECIDGYLCTKDVEAEKAPEDRASWPVSIPTARRPARPRPSSRPSAPPRPRSGSADRRPAALPRQERSPGADDGRPGGRG